MVTTRSPPTSDCMITMPGCSATTSPMIAAFRPSGWARIDRQKPVGVLGRHDGDQLALVGDVERIEAQHLAGAAHVRPHRDRGLRRARRRPARRPPARSARWTARRASGRACSGCRDRPPASTRLRSVSGRRVAFQHRLELDPLAHRHDGDAVVADRARDEDAVAGPGGADRQATGPRAPGRCRTS